MPPGPRRPATLAALLAAGWALPAAAPVAPPVARALRVPLRLRDSATVALTFDDGPHPLGTPAILDLLAAAGARACFFLLGEQVRRTGALAAEIVAAGHTVGVHGDRHRTLQRLTPAALTRDLDRAGDTIASATGTIPALHRAPYGVYSWPALAEVRRRGWTPVLWSAWGRDWARGATGASVAARVEAGLGPAGVVLLHDADDYSVPGSWRATAAALPRILDAIGERALRPVALAPQGL
jgi:peptidoglycan/xylan/chitin deacetylase (PgdA/CDA1 family)